MSDRPIGIFDSGVGGLTVWKTLLNEFKQESFIYFADSNNCPYGNKTEDSITQLSVAIVEFLISKNCKWVNISQMIAMVFIFIHGLNLGQNLQSNWMEFIWISMGALLIPCFALMLQNDWTFKNNNEN